MSNDKLKILFIFTGSIAIYKATNILSRLVQRGHSVECVLTKSALKFIGLSTIEGLTGRKAHVDLYDSENIMSHIQLIRDAHVVLVAPATANFINKIACGLADDLASTLFLAHDFKKPFIMAPAMNTKMYEHPQTQLSIKHLKSLGVSILESGSGILACGEVGYGKLLEPEIILEEIDKILRLKNLPAAAKSKSVKERIGPRVLITGGGTSEPIDDVRSITNSSTGETAIQIACYLFDLGIQTTLVLNNQKNLSVPDGLRTLSFETFNDLNRILKNQLATEHYDLIIHAAAVSDFSLEKIEGLSTGSSTRKVSSTKNLKLVLKPNFKIISKLGHYSLNKNVAIVGFKLTSHANKKQAAEAVTKLFAYKNVQFVVHNDIKEIDRKNSIHRFNFYKKFDQSSKSIETKEQLLNQLVEIATREVT